MQEQSHRGKSAGNPHSHSSSDLRDLETSALKKGNQGPGEATNQARRRNTGQWDQGLLLDWLYSLLAAEEQDRLLGWHFELSL